MPQSVYASVGIGRPLGSQVPHLTRALDLGLLSLSAPLLAQLNGVTANTTTVIVRFQLVAGQFLGQYTPASDQHVYLDTTSGSMTHYRTDGQGNLVDASGSGAVSLDPSREYHIITSSSPVSPAPIPSNGTSVRIINGTITVVPQVLIHITDSNGNALSDVGFILKVGTNESTSRTTSDGSTHGLPQAGWIWSNDRSSGAITLRSDSHSLKQSGASDPVARLSINPASPTRGNQVTISIQQPPGSFGFKVTNWQYDISHTNPGDSTPSVATVIRPATENAGTFHRSWAGILYASGTAKATFVVGVKLRDTGSGAIQADVVASDPIESTLNVTVVPRTGNNWVTQVDQLAEVATSGPITTFHDVGKHEFKLATGNWSMFRAAILPSGPNRGCEFVQSLTIRFVSAPFINSKLTTPSSAFAQAQGKAYLVEPTPVRVIDPTHYTVGAQGAITITNDASFRSAYGIPTTSGYAVSGRCISIQDLITGTRRHEFQGPKSHRSNCLAATRALDPKKFGEAIVAMPDSSLDLQGLVQDRINLIVSSDVVETHNVVDETSTRNQNTIVHTPGESIPDVNANASGVLIGPVWNPATDSQLTN